VRHRATDSPRGRPSRAGLGARLTACASVGAMLVSAVALASALPASSDRPRVPDRVPTTVSADAHPGERVPGDDGPDTDRVTRPTAAKASGTEHWRTVLARLDRRRARAYAAADPGLLRSVYVPGSPVMRRDRRLLARYARRGLHVRGLRTDVEDLRVRMRRHGHVVLLVRDRVAAGTVAGRGRRRPLPADDVDSRLLTLRRVDRGIWLVAAVRPAPT
jgi:eukaryotic-like serine/threonine-protein kinase